MTEAPLPTRKRTEREKILQSKFFEHLAAQSDLMDKISAQLLTVELAIPGLYAALLKLVRGDEAAIALSAAATLAFVLWLAALVLTLLSLFPRRFIVDVSLMKQAAGKMDEALGIEDYFLRTASYKRNLILIASGSFFTGVVCALFI